MIEPTWITAGASLINALTGGGGAPAGPSISGAPITSKADYDFSGFTVATGNARADGAKITKTSSDSLSGNQPTSSSSSSGISGSMILGLAALAGLVWGGS